MSDMRISNRKSIDTRGKMLSKSSPNNSHNFIVSMPPNSDEFSKENPERARLKLTNINVNINNNNNTFIDNPFCGLLREVLNTVTTMACYEVLNNGTLRLCFSFNCGFNHMKHVSDVKCNSEVNGIFFHVDRSNF